MSVDKAALNAMPVGFDPTKSAANVVNPTRGFDFRLAYEFDFETAEIFEDARFDYGEVRYCGIGKIGPRVHVIVFTLRDPVVWVISLRKANDREVRRYEQYLEAQQGPR